jgi:hypothetical protein
MVIWGMVYDCFTNITQFRKDHGINCPLAIPGRHIQTRSNRSGGSGKASRSSVQNFHRLIVPVLRLICNKQVPLSHSNDFPCSIDARLWKGEIPVFPPIFDIRNTFFFAIVVHLTLLIYPVPFFGKHWMRHFSMATFR